MAGAGCTQQTLHFLCDGLEYHLKGNSIPNINLRAQVGSLLVVEKSAYMAMTDSQRLGIRNRHELVRGCKGRWTTELVPTCIAQTFWFRSCLRSSSCVNIQYIPVTVQTAYEQYLQPDWNVFRSMTETHGIILILVQAFVLADAVMVSHALERITSQSR